MAMRVRFDNPDNGWVGISIEDQDSCFEQSLSHAYDSFLELVLALGRLLVPRSTESVTCLVGPAQFDLRFQRTEDVIEFSVVEYPDDQRLKGVAGQTVFSSVGDFEHIGMPFWGALRDLEGRFSKEDLARRWHQAFPHEALDRLTKRIKQEVPTRGSGGRPEPPDSAY